MPHGILDRKLWKKENIAVKDDRGNIIKYGDIVASAEKWNKIIENRNIICILYDKQFETVCFILEMLFIGQPIMILSVDTNKKFIKKLIGKYRPKYIWCGAEKADLYFEEKHSKCIVSNVAGCALHGLYKTAFEKYEIHPDLALLLSTSGSTGSPKLVRISYENLYDHITSMVKKLNLSREHKAIITLPLDHVFGLMFCLDHWHCGATVLVTDESVISKGFEEFYISERVNNIVGVPFTYKMMMKTGFWDIEKLEYLHFAMSSGARLMLEDHEKLVDIMGDKFYAAWGQTECCCICICSNFQTLGNKTGTSGRAIDNTTITVSDEQEMIIHSKSVCMGYAYSYEDLKKADENSGIMYTGDIVYIDEDGYIFIKGRLRRFVKILGSRISLDELEEILNDGIVQGEIVCTGDTDLLCIYYHGEYEETVKERSIELVVSEVAIPRKMINFVKIDKIPRSSSGKILYSKLEKE